MLKSWIFGGCQRSDVRKVFDGAILNFQKKNILPSKPPRLLLPRAPGIELPLQWPSTPPGLCHALNAHVFGVLQNNYWPGCRKPPQNGYTKLRPEVMESLYLLWFVTGKGMYRAQAEKIIKAINKHAKRPQGGYCGVSVASGICPKWKGGEYQDAGSMPSFFIAETLKYYLLFRRPISHL